jgi:predicted lipoprotein with Yx(FWY)xxD motif
MRTRTLLELAVLALAVVACGEDSNGSATTAAGAAPATELATRADTAIGTVVVDAAGMTLYTAEREDDGTVKCIDECVDFWLPAIVDSATPAVTADLTDRIGTVERPDGGGLQATFDDRPLYRFSEDGEPGDTNGDGIEDAFGEAGFVWHAALVDEATATPTTAATGRDPYGGY